MSNGNSLENSGFTSMLNVDSRAQHIKSDHTQSFDSNSSSAVCDNSVNVHICNNCTMFVGEITPYDKMKVETIDGKGHSASGISTIKWK